jgi:hypothetical protein
MSGYVQSLRAPLAAPGGAKLVGFLQAGAAAVAGTLDDAARKTISVTEFGAKCDGVVDDSAAVAAANLFAAGRQIIFPGVVHVPTATTITAVIADTGAKIFSATSNVTIANGRPVRAAWFGAKPDGATESAAPIMRALTAAAGTGVELDAGLPGYKTTAKITLKGTKGGVCDKLYGAGCNATFILAYGADSGIQSDQALADYVDLAGLSIVNKGAPATQIGLDIGTARNSKFKDIIIKDFLIGAALSKNVDQVGDYYNILRDVVADCGAAPAGSIGFEFGNSLAGHTNPTSNANDLFGCRSYGCETGIWINGTGNTIHAHKIVSCKSQVVIVAGYDNDVEAYCESQVPTDSMGSAGATTVGNRLRLFNDALDLVPFVDNGWNTITGNTQAGGLGYPAPFRVLDCGLSDHVNMQGIVGASIPVFSVKLPDVNGSLTLTVNYAGLIFTTGNYEGMSQYHVGKKASGAPTVTQLHMVGDAKLTTTTAADGTVTVNFIGDAAYYSTIQFIVTFQGVATTADGLGSKVIYKRLV